MKPWRARRGSVSGQGRIDRPADPLALRRNQQRSPSPIAAELRAETCSVLEGPLASISTAKAEIYAFLRDSAREVNGVVIFCTEVLESFEGSGRHKWHCGGPRALVRLPTAGLELFFPLINSPVTWSGSRLASFRRGLPSESGTVFFGR